MPPPVSASTAVCRPVVPPDRYASTRVSGVPFTVTWVSAGYQHDAALLVGGERQKVDRRQTTLVVDAGEHHGRRRRHGRLPAGGVRAGGRGDQATVVALEHHLDAGIDQDGHRHEQRREHHREPEAPPAAARAGVGVPRWRAVGAARWHRRWSGIGCCGPTRHGCGLVRRRRRSVGGCVLGRGHERAPGCRMGRSAVMGTAHDRGDGRSSRPPPPEAPGSRAAGRRARGPADRCSTPRGGAPRLGRSPSRAAAPPGRPAGRPPPAQPGPQVVDALPGRHPCRRVAADDDVQDPGAILVEQLVDGVRGVRVATSGDLEIAGLEPLDVADGRGDHGQAVGRRADRSGVGLLPGHVGHRQQDAIERELVAHVDGGDQVAHVGGIEGATEDADPLARAPGVTRSRAARPRVRVRWTGAGCHRPSVGGPRPAGTAGPPPRRTTFWTNGNPR